MGAALDAGTSNRCPDPSRLVKNPERHPADPLAVAARPHAAPGWAAALSPDEFDSPRSAKAAIMLCSLLCDADAADELRVELMRMARVPAIARQLACILATDPALARRFADVLFAARMTLQAEAPIIPAARLRPRDVPGGEPA